MYKYNYNRLKGRITEKVGTISNLISKINMSEPTFYSKINNRTEFKQSEILKICEVLEIPIKNISKYFFYTFS